MRRLTWAFWVCAVLAAGALRAADRPAFAVGRDGGLTVSGLPDVLSRPEVKPHLATGLTTTFAVRVTATDETGKSVKGGGRIDVRWEPWDEVFLTTAVGIDGRVRQESVPSMERLVSWWRGLEILAGLGLMPAARWDVRIDLRVIPFSASEQRDTQRWFSDSLGAKPGAQTHAQEGAGVAPQASQSGILDLLIATSIKRRSVVRYTWTAVREPEHRKGGAA